MSILRDGLDVATREFITAEEASRFLPRPLLRHALERSELFSPSLASQITAVEGGLSIVEANLRTRDRLTGSLDSFVPSVERERQLKPELNETMKRLADSVGKAKSDLSSSMTWLFMEMNRREPPGIDPTLLALVGKTSAPSLIQRGLPQKK